MGKGIWQRLIRRGWQIDSAWLKTRVSQQIHSRLIKDASRLLTNYVGTETIKTDRQTLWNILSEMKRQILTTKKRKPVVCSTGYPPRTLWWNPPGSSVFVAVLCVFFIFNLWRVLSTNESLIDNSQAADEAQNLTLQRIFLKSALCQWHLERTFQKWWDTNRYKYISVSRLYPLFRLSKVVTV